jgi:hypothetical protein
MKGKAGFGHSIPGGTNPVSADFSERDLKAYLLGTLSDEQRSRIEQKYLADERLFESLRGLEQQLIHSYVAGRLSFLDRWRFRRSYLTTEDGKAQVALAKGLAEALPSEVKPSDGLSFVPARGTLAVVAGVCIVACAALSWKLLDMTRAMEALKAEYAALERRTQVSREPATAPFAFTLYPNSERFASSLPNIEVPPDAQVIILKAHVENDKSGSYTATITRLGDRQVAVLEAERNGSFVDVVLPVRLLTYGEYRMSLAGTESGFGESYQFLISRTR